MCGGTASSWGVNRTVKGLSPRVRGNRTFRAFDQVIDGSIPACAGEPPAAPRRTQPPTVYPRVCGGTCPQWPPLPPARGLSPRVRGNHHVRAHGSLLLGSIPACAGEPRARPPAPGRGGVYPRVCGGTASSRCSAPWATGLSPRVRGNLARECAWCSKKRSIPACAGEPPCGHRGASHFPVYPRVCGGTTYPLTPVASPRGLSPRVRGNQPYLGAARVAEGSIPACAGEPRPADSAAPRSPVYPRVCGGTVLGLLLLMGCTGLSPRVRGNRSGGWTRRTRRGSIPACAGEPGSGCLGGVALRVYPRVCGGTDRCAP